MCIALNIVWGIVGAQYKMTTVNISSADCALEQCVYMFEKSSTTEIKM